MYTQTHPPPEYEGMMAVLDLWQMHIQCKKDKVCKKKVIGKIWLGITCGS